MKASHDMKRALFASAAGAILLAVIVRCAWVCDDAFITLRTIDNMVNGHGLRWNIAERVQTFTHPLWMLLLAAFYSVTREPYYTTLVVSISISGLVAWLVAARVARSTLGALFALVILILSKAFVDYSTSGLENPLTHLLLVLFVWILIRGEDGERQPLALTLVAGLALTNRMDLLFVVLPGLVGSLKALPAKRALRVLAIGLAPFLVWELFALIYYGVPFPNSAYAKLATGIPRMALIRQGFLYLLNSLRVDPVTLCVIGAAALFAVRRRCREELLLMAGALSYVAYVLFIGGDFMSGRFFSAPLVVAAAVLSRWRPERPGFIAALPFVILILPGLAVPTAPPFSDANYADRQRGRRSDAARITDERAFYYNETGLLRAGRRGVPMPDHPSARDGRRARERGPAVVVRGGVGFFGYYAGPSVHIVEPWAVTDPLLARLPIPEGAPWRIGHFTRAIPRGYEETLTTGDLRLTDPRIARLYTALGIVMRGPLFRGRRIVEIWRLNTGYYGGE